VLGGDRQAALCREMTKKFEECRRGRLDEIAAQYANAAPKGEIVVLIDRGRSEKISESDLESDLQQAMAGMSVKDAAETVARAHGLPRRQVYQMALKLGKNA